MTDENVTLAVDATVVEPVVPPTVPAETQSEAVDESLAEIKQLVPIAKEVLALISQSDYDLGADQDIDLAKYQTIAQNVLLVLQKYDIKYSSKERVFQLVLQVIENVQFRTIQALRDAVDSGSAKLWGKEINDLQLSDLTRVLKS